MSPSTSLGRVSTPTPRRAARVLLLDQAGCVLLFHGSDPSAPEAGTWWFTPGGGLEPGEKPYEAAVRELAEETGLLVEAARLGKPVHARMTCFSLGGASYAQSEDYYLLRIDAHEVDTTGPGAVVDLGVLGHRWWPVTELAGTTERLFPEELPDLLARLLV